MGTLCYAARVIQPGRSFLRRAISLLSVAREGHHYIKLNAQFRADMLWWESLSSHWNGASLIITKDSREVALTSDASGAWGCGAWHGERWFQLEWDTHTQALHIAAKELIPIMVAAIVWGKGWKGCRVVANCDNSAVVAVLNSRYCQDSPLMQMLRCLFFIEAKGQLSISAVHLPGVHNELADDLSRNRLAEFLTKKPLAESKSTSIPPSLLQWLLHPSMEWTSPVWMRQFSTFVHME